MRHAPMSYRSWLAALVAVLLLGSAALADSPTVLKFSQNGTDLTITATRADDSEQYWRLVLDETRGVITEFYDLTSVAAAGFNFASPYAFGPGLFAPFESGIRQASSGYTYAPGAKVDGQTGYTYTLSRDFTYGTRQSAVTINVPTTEGTWFMGATTNTFTSTATLAVQAYPTMYLHAADETEMNALYAGSVQSDLGIDGTVWAQCTVRNTAEATALGLTPGRTFRLTGLNFTEGGTVGYGDASVMDWNSSFRVCNNVSGGIYDNYASKPPGGSVVHTYVRLDVNITGTGVVPNAQPVANAGSDQTVLDNDDSGDELITLDGRASHDDDGPLISYVWKEGETVIANGDTVNVSLTVGIHTITLTVGDLLGATDTDTVVITIEERVPMTLYVDQKHPAASDDNPGTAEEPFLTIGKAMSTILPGDSVVVKSGIYRERMIPSASGTSDNPITITAQPGQRVVIAGSEELTGWTQLPVGMARGNPHYPNIYYVELDFEPGRLDENSARMEQAKTPNTGWWVVETGSDDTHVVDTVNLTHADPGYWVGAEMYYRDMRPAIEHRVNVVGYDPATSTVTVDGSLSWFDGEGDEAIENPPQPGIDRYQMFNKLEFLDVPGEWVIEDIGGGMFRLYVWPTTSGDANGELYEVTTETGSLISLGTRSHLVIDGFEVRHTSGYARAINVSGSSDITLQNLIAHDNEYMGFAVTDSERIIVRNSLSFQNGYGLAIGSSTDIAVYENNVHNNTVDGIVISYDAYNIYIERNYVHDHVLYGHPDNLQFHHGVYNIWFEDNAIINSGQSCMMEEGHGVHFINNIVAGSSAYMLHTGQPVTGLDLQGNTLAFSGYGLIGIRDTTVGLTFDNNIYYHGHPKVMWGAGTVNNYTADHNLFYQGPGIPDTGTVAWNGTWTSVANFAILSGQDAASFYADPQLVNVPAYWAQMESNDLPEFTSNSVSIRDYSSYYVVGDHIEFNFDGVMRTITAKDGTWITYDPPHDEPLLLGGCIANWKTNTDPVLDFSLGASSPAIGAGAGGTNMGSSVNLAQYRAGDFDGDGSRDIPEWPPVEGPPELVITAALDGDWVYQNADGATGNRHVRILTVEITDGEVPGETYQVTLEEEGGPVMHFQITQPVVMAAAAVAIDVAGGNLYTTTAPNSATLTVTVTRVTGGQEATANVDLVLRRLGDINGDSVVDTEDKLFINRFLNGIPATYPAENFDLNADTVVDTADKLLLNQMLNGIAVP
jgi:parallel beta-helix repeat protein